MDNAWMEIVASLLLVDIAAIWQEERRRGVTGARDRRNCGSPIEIRPRSFYPQYANRNRSESERPSYSTSTLELL